MLPGEDDMSAPVIDDRTTARNLSLVVAGLLGVTFTLIFVVSIVT